MKNACRTLLLAAAALVLTGCANATGHWTLQSITPSDAGENYMLAHLTLRSDGTYCACPAKMAPELASTGQYTFDDDKLSLTPADGKTTTYDAKLMAMGSKLEVKSTVDGKEVTAVMERCKGFCKCCGAPGKCCHKCGKCKKCCTCGKAKECSKKCEKPCVKQQ